MSNFFNAIGVADMEKVHSAMIAWILDDKNDSTMPGANTGSSFSTFDLTTRSHLLCDIFGEQKRVFNSIETFVEWNDIDILILTEDQNNVKECWVIENKLKSQEHESKSKYNNKVIMWQTEKYEEVIANELPTILNRHYLLLSLTGEQAKSRSKLWKSGTYEDLCNILSGSLIFASPIINPIIKEYYIAIKKLCDVLNDFLVNYLNYPIAISSKTKNANKSQVLSTSTNPNEKYVIENSLETIFQKSLLIKQMGNYTKNSSNPCYDCNYKTSASSDGTATLVVFLDDFTDTTTKEIYHVQIEFQNGSFKVQIHQIENDGTMGSKGTFLAKWEKVFDEIAKNNTNWKKNLPKPNSKRPFISISTINNNWYNDIQGSWNSGFGECVDILKKLKKEFETQHSTKLVPFP